MVSFISPTAHQKFIKVCNTVIDIQCNLGEPVMADEKIFSLKADLERLQLMAEEYKALLDRLPELTKDYYLSHRKIRMVVRKLQMAQTATNGPKKKNLPHFVSR